MNRDQINEYIETEFPLAFDEGDILLADGFEEAFLGVAEHFGPEGTVYIAVYNTKKCIEILERDMPHEEAVEYFQFNTLGAYVGPNTPAFMTVAERSDDAG
jgi:hypothetical protein